MQAMVISTTKEIDGVQSISMLYRIFKPLVYTYQFNHQRHQSELKVQSTMLRVSMPYHRFTNFREIFQADLSRNRTNGLSSQGLENHYPAIAELVRPAPLATTTCMYVC